MKLGRNDPCHCGSGKKYKRCCLDAVSKQHTQVADDIEAVMAMNPQLSLDELDAVLKHKVEDRNNQPHADFCGLSPTQMSNWLYAPFDELQWVTINTPESFSASPVMRYLELIIDEAMQNSGLFKATSKGNLPTKLVKQASGLSSEFAVSQFPTNISISEFAGSNEDKFNALHYTRVLAEISGIIYRRSGRYHVKKSAQKLYQTQGMQAFFKPMLEAAISKYNWAYFDNFDDDIDLRNFWLFMLWRVQTHQSLDELIEEVMKAFPHLLSEITPDDYFSPEKTISLLIESRFIVRFLQFWGFLVIDPKHYLNNEAGSRVVQIQPLLRQTFQFSIN